MPAEEWTNPEHVDRYLDRADEFPRRAEGESVLLDIVPRGARRILDLGTGDGRLLAMAGPERGGAQGGGLVSPEVMPGAARGLFAGDRRVELVQHDLAE